MAMIWGQKVREQIDQISEDIQHGEVFGQLNKLVEQNRQKVLIAKSILQPSDNQKEANALKKNQRITTKIWLIGQNVIAKTIVKWCMRSLPFK